MWTADHAGAQDDSGPAPSCWRPGRCPTTACPTSAASTPIAGHKIHSARWDHDYDFAGKRVAVIGTGASAIQIIPELVKQAEFVKVFQRTPGWVLPRLDVADAAPRRRRCSPKCLPPKQLARQALYWGHEASATALVWNTPLTSLVARLGKAHLRRAGQRSVAAPPAHPGLHPRLQADADLQRLLPRAAARQLQAHRLADRHDEPGRHPHQRRHRAPPGLHRVRHRIRRAPDRPAVPGHRARRTVAARRMGRRRAGVQEHQRARLPQPVLHDRPELRARPQLAAGLRRGADRLRGRGHHHDPRTTTCAISMSARTSSGATTSASRSGSPRRPGCRAAAAGT